MPGIEKQLFIATWVLVLLLAGFVAFIPSEVYITSVVFDDALYYPTIARSIAKGMGSTYDNGITVTNGYHPLWCWMQVGVASVFGHNAPMAYLWWVKLLMVIVVICALYVWFRLIRTVFGDAVPTMVYLLLLGGYWWSIRNMYGGMETPLVILFMGLSILQALRIRDTNASPKDVGLLGLLMGGTLLARLDSVFFIAALSVGILILFTQERRYFSIPLCFGVAVVTVIPYLLWNRLTSGSFVPVSGLAKTEWSDFASRFQTFSEFWVDKWDKTVNLIRPIGFILIALLIIAAIGLCRREVVEGIKKWRLLWALPAGALIHYAYTSILMTEGDVMWYQYTEYLAAYLVVATIAYGASRWLYCRWTWARFLSVGATAAILVLIVALYLPGKIPQPVPYTVFNTASWARQNLPHTARYGMYDSGVFRFVSDFDTMSLNGLAGDRELLELVREHVHGDGHTKSIIDRYDIDYVVTYAQDHEIQAIGPDYIVYVSPELEFEDGVWRLVIVKGDHYRQGGDLAIQ